MHELDDVARFLPGSPGPVVEASFACPLCLHRPTQLLVTDDGEGPQAGCRCAPCDIGWTVGLTSEQLLRLRLGPPPGLLVQLDSGTAARRWRRPG